MKAGDKEGRREERKSSYGYCCHLGDFQWCLQKWNFLGSLLLLPCGEEHAIWLEQRDHTNVEAALYHLLGQRWPFVGCRGSLPKDVLQALPDVTLPLHSFLIWLPIRALLVHRGNCWHCLKRDRKEKLKVAAYSLMFLDILVIGLRARFSVNFLINDTLLGHLGYMELSYTIFPFLPCSGDINSDFFLLLFIHWLIYSTNSWMPTTLRDKTWDLQIESLTSFYSLVEDRDKQTIKTHDQVLHSQQKGVLGNQGRLSGGGNLRTKGYTGAN